MNSRRLLLSVLFAACALVVGLVVWLAAGGGGAAVDGVGAPVGSGVSQGAGSSTPLAAVEEPDAERSDSGSADAVGELPSRPDRASRVTAQVDELEPRFDVFVVDPAGKPVLGAQVLGLASFELEGDATVHPFGLTDAAGRLEVPCSQAFSHLTARAHGFAGSRPIDVRHRAPERGEPAERVRIVLLPGKCTLHLRVQDERGSPVPTARVLLGLLNTSDDATRPLTLPLDALDFEPADLPGEFIVRNLPRGEHALVAFHDELGLWRGSVVLEPDETTRVEVTLIALPRRNATTLAGRVTDSDGAPLHNWTVLVGSKDQKARTGYFEAGHGGAVAHTDDDGRWQMEDLGRRPYRVEVHGPSMTNLLVAAAVVQETMPGGPFLDIVVSETAASGWLTGSLVVPSTMPLDKVHVHPALIGRPPVDAGSGWWQLEDVLVPVEVGTGAFRTGPLSPGIFQLTASFDGNRYDLTGPVEVLAGESFDLGALELDASASFSARLSPGAAAWLRERTTSSDGTARWDVTLIHHTRPWLMRMTLPKETHEVIEYEHMVPGLYRLDGWPRQAGGDRLIELRAGEELHLELDVEEHFARASARMSLCVDARLTLGDLLRFDLYSRSGELVSSQWQDIEPGKSRETRFHLHAGEYVLEISDGEITYSSTRITSRPFIDHRSDPHVNWISIGDGACE